MLQKYLLRELNLEEHLQADDGRKLEVIAETTTPTDEGGEETITEDLEVTPAVSEDCSERADLEDSFVLDEGALEED